MREGWYYLRPRMFAPEPTPVSDDQPVTHPDISPHSPMKLLGRALLLRCPNCGGKHIFTGFFDLKERCPGCGMLLERGESDYFLGAYTVNLFAVEALLALGFLVAMLLTWPTPPWDALEYGGLVLSVLGAVFCYPFAKTTWLAVDLMFRPQRREDFITRVK